MKRKTIWLLVCALSLLSFSNPKTYYFISRFQPNSTYKVDIGVHNVSSVRFVADKETLARLWNAGLKNPTRSTSEQTMIETVTTGKMAPDSSFFIRMVVDSFGDDIRINGVQKSSQDVPSLSGMEASGVYTKDGRIMYLRVEGGKLDDDMRNAIAATVEKSLGDIKYPDAPIAIGDSFQQQIPLDLPVPGFNPVHLQMTITYKLVRVDGDTAYFDNGYKMEMNQNTGEYKLDVEGSGTGTLKHNLSRNFFIEHSSHLRMTARIKTDNLEIDESSEVEASTHYR